jgi:hypothetical protein
MEYTFHILNKTLKAKHEHRKRLGLIRWKISQHLAEFGEHKRKYVGIGTAVYDERANHAGYFQGRAGPIPAVVCMVATSTQFTR